MKMKDEAMKAQELGEWRTNPFLDPQVQRHIQQIREESHEMVMKLKLLEQYVEWVNKTYPDMPDQYRAIKDLEAADWEAKYGFFGEIKIDDE